MDAVATTPTISEVRAAIDSFYGDGRLDERVAALMRRANAGDKAAIAAMDAAEAKREMGLHWKSLNIPN
jgi:hypothetical protein